MELIVRIKSEPGGYMIRMHGEGYFVTFEGLVDLLKERLLPNAEKRRERRRNLG